MKRYVFLLFILSAYFSGRSQSLITIAGNTKIGYYGSGFTGDGDSATFALLNAPMGIALDKNGNVYFADCGNNRVREIDTSQIITTVAGNGGAMYIEGYAATGACLHAPSDVVVDSAGNIYIVNTGDNVINKVDRDGFIHRVCGMIFISGYSGDGGQATNALLNAPSAMEIDKWGRIYIADTRNQCIRMVDTNGIIRTIAGNGGWAVYPSDGSPATDASIGWPTGVAVDALGNIYIAANNIWKVDSHGLIGKLGALATCSTPLGDGGPSTNAAISPSGKIKLDAEGNIYFADNGRLRRIDRYGIIQTIAGNGNRIFDGDGSATAKGVTPVGIAVDQRDCIFIADPENNNLRKLVLTDDYLAVQCPDEKNAIRLTVWPNPNTGTFMVLASSQINQSIPATVTNGIGEEVLRLNLSTNKETKINLKMPDIYLLTSGTGSSTQSVKIFVQ